MILMITEPGTKVHLEGGKIHIRTQEGEEKTLPKELLESVSLFGNIQLTTQFVQHCLRRQIPISYFSMTGTYFGRCASTNQSNVLRLKKQMELLEDDAFQLGFSKNIVEAKTKNQLTILQRYKDRAEEIEEEIQEIGRIRNKIQSAKTKKALLGYEGSIARYYYRAIGKLLPQEFEMKGRSKRPPKDPFNSMLSLGYTLLTNEMIGQIESVGLSPYGGILHGHRRNHPSLASDMIEEFRQPLIDSTVLNLLCKDKTTPEDFEHREEGVFLKKDFLKIYVASIQKKMRTEQSYVKDHEIKLTYRNAIYHQCNDLARAIEAKDYNLYQPLRIR